MSLSLNNITNGTAYFCDDHPGTYIFWAFLIIASFVLGFPGTVVVLLDIFQKGRKGTSLTPNDVFMSNLTVMDGLFMVLLLPNLQNNVNNPYGKVLSFLFSLNLCGRPLFVSCICLDCYMAVVHPITYRARKSLTPRILMAVGVWTVTVATGIYYVVRPTEGFNDPVPILFFALTLPVVGFCDLSILWTLKRSKLGGKDIHPQKKKAVKIIINNLLISITSYVPPIIILVVANFLIFDTMMFCLVVVPVMGITFTGNTVSLILHLITLGKLDWLQIWKHK